MLKLALVPVAALALLASPCGAGAPPTSTSSSVVGVIQEGVRAHRDPPGPGPSPAARGAEDDGVDGGAQPVPEPATLMIVGLGLVALALHMANRRRRPA